MVVLYVMGDFRFEGCPFDGVWGQCSLVCSKDIFNSDVCSRRCGEGLYGQQC